MVGGWFNSRRALDGAREKESGIKKTRPCSFGTEAGPTEGQTVRYPRSPDRKRHSNEICLFSVVGQTKKCPLSTAKFEMIYIPSFR